MKRRASLLAVVLMATACGGNATPDTTSTTTSASIAPASTSTSSTTTTTEPVPVVLEIQSSFDSPLRAIPGRTYVHDHSLVDVLFTFTESGWVFDQRTALAVGYTKDSGGTRIGGQLFFLGMSRSEVVSLLVNDRMSRQVTSQEPTLFGGLDALTFDVETVDPSAGRIRDICGALALGVDPTSDGELTLLGAPGCTWNRVWLVELDGGTMVATIGDLQLVENDELEELPETFPMPSDFADVIAELEAAVTIGG